MFWIGLLVGVSFLATPAKFLAPSLSLPVALDVGRHTFAIFSKAEWLLAASLLVILLAGRRSSLAILGGGLAAVLVAVEAAWLLPVLDQRVGLIIAGQQPPASNLHEAYIAIEGVKLLSLGLVASVTARYLTRR
ncbi:hypothetical protein FHP25_20985 [Vineibacter terrae]|uniref:DUF4149 domain-containing protein n=2 Tax=Vineibacter terrae TaxID=2586908 RepID=A0A5C8PI60_9HYPH|nr:hypothetical protein FHP25_20985 [Vineibacter terrae]